MVQRKLSRVLIITRYAMEITSAVLFKFLAMLECLSCYCGWYMQNARSVFPIAWVCIEDLWYESIYTFLHTASDQYLEVGKVLGNASPLVYLRSKIVRISNSEASTHLHVKELSIVGLDSTSNRIWQYKSQYYEKKQKHTFLRQKTWC